MKIKAQLMKLIINYKERYIEAPIKEKYANLKESDVELYKSRVKEEVGKIIAIQYILPATIITVCFSYSIIYFSKQFINYLGGF
ncbi:hypothetical protein [Staphylococcus shinii]|uniref:hypothetical protein n=1 Tax=Staphylococcus shinii TaxID=2912228 RepID=UPI003F547A6B